MSVLSWCKRKPMRFLTLVTLIALALRLALWSQPLHQPANDETEYIPVAYDLLEGRGWQFYNHYHWLRAPLYPLFLAGSLWLSGGHLHLAALPNIVLSTATVILVFFLTKAIVTPFAHHAGYRDALADAHEGQHDIAPIASCFAALLATLLLTMNTFASLYMSETLFTFLFTASLLLLLHGGQHCCSRHSAARWSLAGVLYGLATITRSVTMAFIPWVLLWIIAISHGGSSRRGWKSVAHAVPFLIGVLLPIAPWTIRNCLAYERCILIETGFSFNLWAFSEPHESRGTIYRTLEQIPDPAVRAAEASRRGMARLREDPMIVVRKLWPNWIDLWRIKPIEDRFLMSSYHDDPPPLLFLLALVFDDMLYAGILVNGVIGCTIGIVHPRYRRSSLLLCGWIATVVGTTLLTHAEGRYRHFFFSLLIPYAAIGFIWTVHALRGIVRRTPRAVSPPPTSPASEVPMATTSGTGSVTLRAWLAGTMALSLLVMVCYPLLVYYPWEWARTGAVRSLYRLVGDTAMALNQLDIARVSYERAYEARKTQEGRLRIGDVFRRRGDLVEAEAHYRAGWLWKKLSVGANARLGEVLRAQKRDDEARKAFAGYFVAEQEMIHWSWNHLPIEAPTTLDVGNGLDFGLVHGVYDAETQQGATARWTNGYGQFRLATPTASETPSTEPVAGTALGIGSAAILRMRIAAPHPDHPMVPVQVCAHGMCQQVRIGPTWRNVQLLLPSPRRGYLVVALHSAVFAAPDGRRLGILVDWLRLSSTQHRCAESVLQW